MRRLTPAEAGSRASGIADARLVTRAMMRAVGSKCDSAALQDAWREADTKLYLMEVEALRQPGDCAEPARAKPTIPLRIRVGVTADGVYLAAGTNDPSDPTSNGEEMTSAMSDALGGEFVAWHWITAEVPMPEVEHGETRGEVEP